MSKNGGKEIPITISQNPRGRLHVTCSVQQTAQNPKLFNFAVEIHIWEAEEREWHLCFNRCTWSCYINIFTLTMDHLTVCDVKGVAHYELWDSPTRLCISVSLSSLFRSYGHQLYGNCFQQKSSDLSGGQTKTKLAGKHNRGLSN